MVRPPKTVEALPLKIHKDGGGHALGLPQARVMSLLALHRQPHKQGGRWSGLRRRCAHQVLRYSHGRKQRLLIWDWSGGGVAWPRTGVVPSLGFEVTRRSDNWDRGSLGGGSLASGWKVKPAGQGSRPWWWPPGPESVRRREVWGREREPKRSPFSVGVVNLSCIYLLFFNRFFGGFFILKLGSWYWIF
jgi:hypothetical protein